MQSGRSIFWFRQSGVIIYDMDDKLQTIFHKTENIKYIFTEKGPPPVIGSDNGLSLRTTSEQREFLHDFNFTLIYKWVSAGKT